MYQPPEYDPRYGPQQPVIYVQPHRPDSGMATASMVLGIIGLLGGWCLFGIPCILAVILGHVARKETKPGHKGGDGQAVAGLVMGYVVVGPAIAISVFVGGLGAVGSAMPARTSSPAPVVEVTSDAHSRQACALVAEAAPLRASDDPVEQATAMVLESNARGSASLSRVPVLLAIGTNAGRRSVGDVTEAIRDWCARN